ncbi:MAG TPA: hypothetical protein VFL98_02950 [Candidatus Paceibacterota bacterium]|nr:hypothetical protein [Candidatus Paceibacterota bacterium]
MPPVTEMHEEKPLMRHVIQLLIVLVALICAGVLAYLTQRYLYSRTVSGTPGATADYSTTTPEELTLQQKMEVLQSLESGKASGTGTQVTGVASGTVSSEGNEAPANDARTQTLDQLDAQQQQQQGDDGDDSGMSAQEKLNLLNSLH